MGDNNGNVSQSEILTHLRAEAEAIRRFDEEALEFDAESEAADWTVCHDLDESGEVSREEYTATLSKIGGAYAQAQAEGACDEGCDTPIKRAGHPKQKHPVDLFP